ncbi:MAG TPA: AmmeMemoRadiSam system protein A [Thermoanaerobaculia bacterium]|nr:AmmeMemoRadiSam system protein A [Thermoanaerobaculia bacterium]
MLTPAQQTTLLRIARDSIGSRLEGRSLAIDPAGHDEALRRPSGAFVTLRAGDGQLRGCIGSVAAVDPLCRAVAQSAVNAAFCDPRFPPLRGEEFPLVGLEISVMGPVVPVSAIDEIVCGRDGLIVSRGSFAGLLLPQVASERSWDRETFLRHACLKAGLHAWAWREEDTRIARFSAEVFCE